MEERQQFVQEMEHNYNLKNNTGLHLTQRSGPDRRKKHSHLNNRIDETSELTSLDADARFQAMGFKSSDRIPFLRP
jgi:hypothetical protein